MESSVSKELEELSANIGILASQRDEARAALKRASEEIEDLKKELEQAREELHQKDLDVEFLTLSHRLAESPQSLADARATVKRILGKVDKAIALLKDDARL